MTNKQISLANVAFLNKLEVIKNNKLLACNHYYTINGVLGCDIYNKSNRKRVKIRTSVIFEKPEFISDPENYILNSEWYKKLF